MKPGALAALAPTWSQAVTPMTAERREDAEAMNTLDIAVDEAVRTRVAGAIDRSEDRVESNGAAGRQRPVDYVEELREALSRIGRLRGLLSVCTYCNRIGDGRESWHDLSEPQAGSWRVALGRTICPDCYVSIIRPESELLYTYFNESGQTASEGPRGADIDRGAAHLPRA